MSGPGVPVSKPSPAQEKRESRVYPLRRGTFVPRHKEETNVPPEGILMGKKMIRREDGHDWSMLKQTRRRDVPRRGREIIKHLFWNAKGETCRAGDVAAAQGRKHPLDPVAVAIVLGIGILAV